TSHLFFGNRNASDRTFSGNIARVVVYDGILTSTERGREYSRYLASSNIAKSKFYNFNAINKPTDLSVEVDNTVGDNLVSLNFVGNWNAWLGGSIITNSSFTSDADGGGIYKPILVIGKKYRVSFSGSQTGGSLSMGSTATDNYVSSISGTNFSYTGTFTATGNTNLGIFNSGNTQTVTFTNFSVQELTGLVAAYNMIPQNGILVDIGANGYNATQTVAGSVSTLEGIKFNNASYYDANHKPTANGSLLIRFKAHLALNQYLYGSKLTNDRMFIAIDVSAKFCAGVANQGIAVIVGTTTLLEGKEYTGAITWDGTTVELWLNGSKEYSSAQSGVIANTTRNNFLGALNDDGVVTLPTKCEITDIREYNRKLSDQEIKDYHNSFVKPVLIEDFSDVGADGVVKTPREWAKGTGTYKIGELTAQDAVLKDLDVGAKYLECVTAGTIATQSTQVYGEWEFDVNSAIAPFVNFISDNKIAYNGFNGYTIYFYADGKIDLTKSNTGSGNNLFRTAVGYHSKNTWYRLKVARLQSEGVFKDIPTLQVSDMENDISPTDYTTFTSNGRYGFSVTSDGSAIMIAGTADEIAVTDTKKYLIEFDAVLNSGTAPQAKFAKFLGGTGQSNTITVINGRNSHILTATGTDTDVLQFFNVSTTTDYEVSGLTIRRIYDKDTFAVFIKGGAFGNTWTLVSTAGGSGTNPVTDATYTTSNYIVVDADAGDRVGNIKILNGVRQ
ncbi:MAG: LamG-like jellyroll fold domain-containing protein, partial [Bacteroidota bacterium]